jgi:sulfatase modifying factor 1
MLQPHTQTIQNHTFTMLPIQGGRFLMGSPEDDAEGYKHERPQHEVSVSDFLIGQYPVTQALWKAVMNGENPSNFQGDEHPVEQVSWDDITQKLLPELRNITGLQYRLPTEAEWEYAARGGKYHDEGYKYAGSDRLKDVGWFFETSNIGTKPVGQKSANQLGIYDMSGNLWEWCEDDWHDNYDQAPNDGRAWIDSPERGTYRVARGGGWYFDAQYCRTVRRNYWLPGFRNFDLGFRLALSLQADGCPFPAFL